MSILLNKSTRVIVQGITGREAGFHSRDMLRYGTQIVAGVTPGKGGSWVLDEKVPVFDSMRSAVEDAARKLVKPDAKVNPARLPSGEAS